MRDFQVRTLIEVQAVEATGIEAVADRQAVSHAGRDRRRRVIRRATVVENLLHNDVAAAVDADGPASGGAVFAHIESLDDYMVFVVDDDAAGQLLIPALQPDFFTWGIAQGQGPPRLTAGPQENLLVVGAGAQKHRVAGPGDAEGLGDGAPGGLAAARALVIAVGGDKVLLRLSLAAGSGDSEHF